MIRYASEPLKIWEVGSLNIASFVSKKDKNIDWKTIDSFSQEWSKFNDFTTKEIVAIGNDYFDLIDKSIISPNITLALDVGCGSGRWAKYLSDKVKFIEAIDPSDSVFSASTYLQHNKNVRVTQASIDRIPFPDKSFDFVYSLGVLHHLPDTLSAIKNCMQKIKPGGWFLLYLYYALENRGVLYRIIFKVSSIFRWIISRLPFRLKQIVCDLIALTIYWPASMFSRFLSSINALKHLSNKIPLSYYAKTSFKIMRNDALDRFGTPLEKRFSRVEIKSMLKENDFVNIKFSETPPYWHVIAQRPQ